MTIDDIIAGIVAREGGYSNDPSDSGGETCWGITKAEARANGYEGAMQDMPKSTALRIYSDRYVRKPSFDRIAAIDSAIGAELVDTGVNMGPVVAGRFLQRALNAFNRGGTDYADVIVDGVCGLHTRAALQAFINKRGGDGQRVMLSALNALQGEHYIAIIEHSPKNEKFGFGWFLNRVCAA